MMEPLWVPATERVQSSTMTGFITFVNNSSARFHQLR